MTGTLYAGTPEALTPITLPRTARTVRVTDVVQSNGALRIAGVIDDSSQLSRGESPLVEITVDRSKGIAQAQFFGTDVSMRLEEVTR